MLVHKLLHNHKLQDQYVRNIQNREIVAAQHGINPPLAVVNEIAQYKRGLLELEQEREMMLQSIYSIIERYVVELIEQYVWAQKRFSAYGITNVLREQRATVAFDHDLVKKIVHAQMLPFIKESAYYRSRKTKDKASFYFYTPQP